ERSRADRQAASNSKSALGFGKESRFALLLSSLYGDLFVLPGYLALPQGGRKCGERRERKNDHRPGDRVGTASTPALGLMLTLQQYIEIAIEQAGNQLQRGAMSPVLAFPEIRGDGLRGFRFCGYDSIRRQLVEQSTGKTFIVGGQPGLAIRMRL